MADADALLEQQIPALRRYAYGLVRNAEAADDLVQDTLERALSRWVLRRGEGDLRAWLFAILHNRYVDQYRRTKRQGDSVDLDDASVPPSPPRQEAGLEMQDVLAALDQLPAEQKSLLLLVGVEDLSYDEAARVAGVPIGTVMSRLARARQKLRSILETGRATLLRRVK
jgi:RNA polymerase sigma factor (sigma-70 family)